MIGDSPKQGNREEGPPAEVVQRGIRRQNTAMTRKEQEAVLRLAHAEGVGAVTYRRLVRIFGSPEAALAAPEGRQLEVPELGAAAARAIRAAAEDPWAEKELARAAELGVTLLCLGDESYPKTLLNTYDPPPVLYVKGAFQPADALAVAIVGSRQATPYGRKQAERLAAGLALAGFTVVSGLARGIDTAAHRGALAQAGGRTVAVLGNGLETCYPPENAELLEQIATGGGAVLSEVPFDAPPSSANFPRRNRIIAGLSLGVIVVEGKETSGALITARHAVDMDREVFAVPGPVDSPAARGPHRLIKKGAKLVEDVEDVLEELRSVAEPLVKFRPPDERLRLPKPRDEDEVGIERKRSEREAAESLFGDQDGPGDDEPAPVGAAKSKKAAAKGGRASSKGKDPRPDTTDLRAVKLNEREQRVFGLLDPSQARGIDELIKESGLQAHEVLATLLVLEVRRLCKQLPGKRFVKA